MWSLILPSQTNKSSSALSQLRVLVTGMCPILGTGDSEKAVGEEITNQLLLAPDPVQKARTERRIQQHISQSPSIAAFWETHILWDPVLA